MKNGMKVVVLIGSYKGMIGEIIRISGGVFEVFFGVDRGRGYIGSWLYEENEILAVVN